MEFIFSAFVVCAVLIFWYLIECLASARNENKRLADEINELKGGCDERIN